MGTNEHVVRDAYAAFKQSYGAAHAFTVRNGKIVRFREYVDVGAALS